MKNNEKLWDKLSELIILLGCSVFFLLGWWTVIGWEKVIDAFVLLRKLSSRYWVFLFAFAAYIYAFVKQAKDKAKKRDCEIEMLLTNKKNDLELLIKQCPFYSLSSVFADVLREQAPLLALIITVSLIAPELSDILIISEMVVYTLLLLFIIVLVLCEIWDKKCFIFIETKRCKQKKITKLLSNSIQS